MEPSLAPRSHGRGISRLAMRLSALLVLALLGLAGVGAFAIGGIHEVGERWAEYDLGAAAKADALSDLRAAMGFGGAIHEFKDFLLTGDPARAEKARLGLKRAGANLEVYRYAATLTPAEKSAVDTVAAVLTALGQRLDKAAAAIADRQPLAEVVRAADLDVAPPSPP